MKKHLWEQYRSHFKQELNLFRIILTKEEFLEWYEDVPQYDFEEGQEPDLQKIRDQEYNQSDLTFQKEQRQKEYSSMMENFERKKKLMQAPSDEEINKPVTSGKDGTTEKNI